MTDTNQWNIKVKIYNVVIPVHGHMDVRGRATQDAKAKEEIQAFERLIVCRYKPEQAMYHGCDMKTAICQYALRKLFIPSQHPILSVMIPAERIFITGSQNSGSPNDSAPIPIVN